MCKMGNFHTTNSKENLVKGIEKKSSVNQRLGSNKINICLVDSSVITQLCIMPTA